MDLGLQGKRALVCAASKGLGKAMAVALAQEGVSLFLCARDSIALEATAAEIRELSAQPVHTLACDLTVAGDRDRLIQAVKREFPTLDILIHNVGGPAPSTVETTSLALWQQGFERLFLSVAHLNEAFVPGMKTRQWGRILLVTSIAVLEPVGHLAVSNGMRSAVTAMAKTLADEVAPYQVTVNCLAPGWIATDRMESLVQAEIEKTGQTREAYLKQALVAIPAGRSGTPQEFGAVAAFLCSEQAAYVTGSTLCVDGGKRRSTY